uniref:Uncharacterized protein n=1 Tax=viral metagenome TaxID=1070528 RepID=A0A6C0CHZ7_9ZZZZ
MPKKIYLFLFVIILVAVIAYMVMNKDKVIMEHMHDLNYPDVPDDILKLPEPIRTKAIQDFMNSPQGLRASVDRVDKKVDDLISKSQAQAADADKAKQQLKNLS